MKMTNIIIKKTKNKGILKAYVTVIFDNNFMLNDIKILDGQNGLFIVVPGNETDNGEYDTVDNPHGIIDLLEMQKMILEKYNAEIKKENIIYELLKLEEIEPYSIMISNVFNEFVGKDYSENGNKTFMEFIEPKIIMERFNNKINQFFVAKNNNEIIGILEIKDNNHISLFFVKKEFHGQGIGKTLFGNFVEILKQNCNNEIKTITVNSSFFAEKIYAKLGFIKTGDIQEKNGIRYIPMEYKV